MCVQDLPRGTFVFLEQFHENLDNIVRLNSQQVFIICLENKFLEGNHFCRTTSLVPGLIILVKVEWMISPSLNMGKRVKKIQTGEHIVKIGKENPNVSFGKHQIIKKEVIPLKCYFYNFDFFHGTNNCFVNFIFNL